MYSRYVTGLAGMLGAFALASTPVPGIAAEQSGIAVSVIPATQAVGAAGNRTLKTQAPVFMGDVIATGPSGEAQGAPVG